MAADTICTCVGVCHQKKICKASVCQNVGIPHIGHVWFFMIYDLWVLVAGGLP